MRARTFSLARQSHNQRPSRSWTQTTEDEPLVACDEGVEDAIVRPFNGRSLPLMSAENPLVKIWMPSEPGSGKLHTGEEPRALREVRTVGKEPTMR